MVSFLFQFICVHVAPDQMMSFGGSQDPCAIVNMSSIGKIDKDVNIKYTEEITKLMATIGVDKER